ncbi:uncharacterized protein [Amphiura filiformis]|uniref:uncharacterized protein n=1 Tax=Amphiura filiformis TaxID=82378 RepID=UPI003B20C980
MFLKKSILLDRLFSGLGLITHRDRTRNKNEISQSDVSDEVIQVCADSSSTDSDYEAMTSLFAGIEKLRSEGTFCDVTIKVGSQEFQAHKNILAASSGYFKVMFTSGFQKAGAAKVTVEGESNIFEVLLHYIYTGDMNNLTEENASEVLSMACYLELAPHALQECKYLIALMFEDKSISMQQAFKISMRPDPEQSDIMKAANGYIKYNFTDLAEKPAFVEETCYECLDMFLDSINKHENDKQIFQVIKKWLQYNWVARKQYACDMLQKLHLDEIPKDDLESLWGDFGEDMPPYVMERKKEPEARSKNLDSGKESALLRYQLVSQSSTKIAFQQHRGSGLKTFRSEKTFCDVTIIVGSKSFPAHKNILAASSGYFKTMFTSGFQEAGSTEVLLEEDEAMFEMILDFIYFGYEISMNKENITEVLDMAVYYQIDSHMKSCMKFLNRVLDREPEQGMCLQQAFEISQRPEPELSDITKLANEYLVENFTQLSKQPKFMDQTTPECMESFLETYFDGTVYRYFTKKKVIFEIVTTWVNHDLNKREQVAKVFLKKSKLHLIPPDILQKALDDGMQDIPECKKTLEEMIAMKNKTMSLQQAFEILQRPENDLSEFAAKFVKKYMKDNFNYLSKQQNQPNFLDQTTKECMETLLTSRLVNYTMSEVHRSQITRSEKNTFKIFARWVNYNWNHRKQLAIDYLKKFNIDCMSTETLQKALDDGMRNIPECKTVLEDVIGLKNKTLSLQRAFEILHHHQLDSLDAAMLNLGSIYIRDNFNSLSKQPEFKDQTTAECMESFLETYYFDNTANRSVEERKDMFEIVSGWINYDLEQRKQFAIIFLKRFKLGLLPSDTLQKALDDGITTIPECKEQLELVITIKTKSDYLTAFPPYITYPKSHWFSEISENTLKAILLHIGGKGMPNNDIRYYNTSGWKGLHWIKEFPERIRYHSTVAVNGHLCVAGGMGRSWGRYKGFGICLSSFYCYDSIQQAWKSLASMTTARANFAIVHMDDFVYAIGGKQNHSVLSSVECYSLVQESWQSIAPLAVGVTDPSAITYKGKILVYGLKSWYSGYVLQIFSPHKTGSNPGGNWSIALDDQKHAARSTNTPKYVLTVQNDKVYRITYEDTNDNKQVVCVTELQCDFDHELPYVHIGATEDQSNLRTILTTTFNTGSDSTSAGHNIFSINRELYANVLGYIYKMGITNLEDVKEYDNKNKIRQLALEDNAGCVTQLTIPQ